MAKRVGLLLSGCGVFDGADIHEGVEGDELINELEELHQRIAGLEVSETERLPA